MTWNGGHMVDVEGTCVICKWQGTRRVSTSTARQMKEFTCGKWNCANELKKLRNRRMRGTA